MLRSARAIKAYFEHKLSTSFELLTEAPETVLDGDIQFNEAMGNHGLWGVRPSSKLAAEHTTEITSTFHDILSGMNAMTNQRDELARLGEKLTHQMEELPSNVIPLRRISEKRPSAVNDRRWTLKLDCLIESNHISEIHKMAMELHVNSRRYAFIEYRDLEVSQRTNLQSLLSLGAISLFIPELTSLSLAEQETLTSLMKTGTVQRPLLMVGATVAYSELRSVPGVHIEFLTMLSRAYIKLSRPFQEYKEQGLIHYFLDCLSEDPS